MSIQAGTKGWSKAFVAALVDPSSPVPKGVTGGRAQVDPLRFAVYRNNVHVGLVEALRKAFPVVERVVGTTFFAAMARAYVGWHKPASPVLLTYGERFPEFISDFAPAARLPYLSDLALLECNWLQSYHAADAPALAMSELANLDELSLAHASLVRHPAARTVNSRYAVGSIWHAQKGDRTGKTDAGKPEVILITRPDAKVEVTVIPRQDARFASCVLAGSTLAAAALKAADADAAFDFGIALTGLVRKGAFTSIANGGETS